MNKSRNLTPSGLPAKPGQAHQPQHYSPSPLALAGTPGPAPPLPPGPAPSQQQFGYSQQQQQGGMSYQQQAGYAAQQGGGEQPVDPAAHAAAWAAYYQAIGQPNPYAPAGSPSPAPGTPAPGQYANYGYGVGAQHANVINQQQQQQQQPGAGGYGYNAGAPGGQGGYRPPGQMAAPGYQQQGPYQAQGSAPGQAQPQGYGQYGPHQPQSQQPGMAPPQQQPMGSQFRPNNQFQGGQAFAGGQQQQQGYASSPGRPPYGGPQGQSQNQFQPQQQQQQPQQQPFYPNAGPGGGGFQQPNQQQQPFRPTPPLQGQNRPFQPRPPRPAFGGANNVGQGGPALAMGMGAPGIPPAKRPRFDSPAGGGLSGGVGLGGNVRPGAGPGNVRPFGSAGGVGVNNGQPGFGASAQGAGPIMRPPISMMNVGAGVARPPPVVRPPIRLGLGNPPPPGIAGAPRGPSGVVAGGGGVAPRGAALPVRNRPAGQAVNVPGAPKGPANMVSFRPPTPGLGMGMGGRGGVPRRGMGIGGAGGVGALPGRRERERERERERDRDREERERRRRREDDEMKTTMTDFRIVGIEVRRIAPVLEERKENGASVGEAGEGEGEVVKGSKVQSAGGVEAHAEGKGQGVKGETEGESEAEEGARAIEGEVKWVWGLVGDQAKALHPPLAASQQQQQQGEKSERGEEKKVDAETEAGAKHEDGAGGRDGAEVESAVPDAEGVEVKVKVEHEIEGEQAVAADVDAKVKAEAETEAEAGAASGDAGTNEDVAAANTASGLERVASTSADPEEKRGRGEKRKANSPDGEEGDEGSSKKRVAHETERTPDPSAASSDPTATSSSTAAQTGETANLPVPASASASDSASTTAPAAAGSADPEPKASKFEEPQNRFRIYFESPPELDRIPKAIRRGNKRWRRETSSVAPSAVGWGRREGTALSAVQAEGEGEGEETHEAQEAQEEVQEEGAEVAPVPDAAGVVGTDGAGGVEVAEVANSARSVEGGEEPAPEIAAETEVAAAAEATGSEAVAEAPEFESAAAAASAEEVPDGSQAAEEVGDISMRTDGAGDAAVPEAADAVEPVPAADSEQGLHGETAVAANGHAEVESHTAEISVAAEPTEDAAATAPTTESASSPSKTRTRRRSSVSSTSSRGVGDANADGADDLPREGDVPQPSVNRISILYEESSRRICVDADVVEKVRIWRGEGRIEVRLMEIASPAEGGEEVMPKGILMEVYDSTDGRFVSLPLSRFRELYTSIPDTLVDGVAAAAATQPDEDGKPEESAESTADSTVPPLHQTLGGSSGGRYTITVWLNKRRPLSEPKWCRSNNADEWLFDTFGSKRTGMDGWRGKLEVMDPDPVPTFASILESWVVSSPPTGTARSSLAGPGGSTAAAASAEDDRREFIASLSSDPLDTLEILLRLARGDRNPTLGTSHGFGSLASAIRPDSPYASHQTHVSLAILQMYRLTMAYADKAGEGGVVQEKVGDIVRSLPGGMIQRSLDGLYREWAEKR